MLSLYFVTALLAQSTTQEVSLEFSARPASEVVAALAKSASQNMMVAGNLAKEPLFVDISDRPVGEVKAALAKALHAEWSEKDGLWTLARSQSKAVQLRQAEAIRLAASLRASQEKVLAGLPDENWTAKMAEDSVNKILAQREEIRKRVQFPPESNLTIFSSGPAMPTPANGVLRSVISKLPAEVMAATLPGKRRVLSTRPNAMQERLGLNLDSSIRAFAQGMNLMAQAVKNANRPATDASFAGGLSLDFRPLQSVSKVNVLLWRSYDGDEVIVGVEIMDQAGVLVGAESVVLTVQPERANPGEIPGDAAVTPELQEYFRVLASRASLSQNVASMAWNIDGDFVVLNSTDALSEPTISSPLRQTLSDPVRRDPLSFMLEGGMKAWQAQGIDDYVIRVPDTLYTQVQSAWSGKSASTTAFVRELMSLCERADNDSLAVLRPKEPLKAEAERIDRVALRDIMAIVQRQGYNRLSDVCAYVAGRFGPGEIERFDTDYLRFLAPYVANELNNLRGQDFLSCKWLASYGTRLDTFAAGTSQAALASMSKTQQDAVRSMVFDAPLQPSIQEGSGSIGVFASDDSATGPGGAEGRFLNRNPTEQYPNGIPGEATVSLNINDEQGVLGRPKGQKSGRIMGATTLGLILGMMDNAQNSDARVLVPTFGEFLPATARSLNVTGTIGKAQFVSSRHRDGVVAQGAKPLALTDLDQAFRDRMEAMRKRSQGTDWRWGGGPTVPPL